MKAIRFSVEAKDEFLEAYVWYERARPGLGDALERAYAERLKTLHVSSPGTMGMRKVYLRSFQYTVIFAERENEVYIVAFAHEKRRPDYRRGRE